MNPPKYDPTKEGLSPPPLDWELSSSDVRGEA